MYIKYHPSLPNVPFQSKIAHNTLLILINDNFAKQEYNSTLQNCVTSSAEDTIFQIGHLQSAFGLQPETVTGTSFVCEGSRPKSFFVPILIAAPSFLSHLCCSVLTDNSLYFAKHNCIFIPLDLVITLLVLCLTARLDNIQQHKVRFLPKSYVSDSRFVWFGCGLMFWSTFNNTRGALCLVLHPFWSQVPTQAAKLVNIQHSTTQIEELRFVFHLFEVPSHFRGSPLGPALQEPSPSKTVSCVG